MRKFDYALFDKLFLYDADTGMITRKVRSGSQPRGREPGCLDRDGYIKICVYGKFFFAHRIAWLLHFGEWPEEPVDHMDGNPVNNKISNLRLANRSVNGKNRALARNNSSGCCGVVWASSAGKWQAQIKSDGVSRYLGVYDNMLDAAAARKSAENRFGFSDRHGTSAGAQP